MRKFLEVLNLNFDKYVTLIELWIGFGPIMY